MPKRGPLTYRQRDLAAAMRAAMQSGFPVREIHIDRDGKIIIVAGVAQSTEAPDIDPELAAALERIKNAKI